MNLRFIIFVTILTTVTVLAASYLAMRFITTFGLTSPHARIVWIGVISFIGLQILGPVFYRMWPTANNTMMIFNWIVYTTMGLFGTLLLYTVIVDVSLLVFKWWVPPEFDLERRSFLGVALLTASSGVLGARNALTGPKVFESEIPLKDLDPDLDGLRIVQISDLHVGPTIRKDYAQNVVNMANSLNADIIALTGDFVDGTPSELVPHLQPLKELKSKYGVFYTTGNHEYYSNALSWLPEFKKLGADVLLNEHRVLNIGKSQLVIAGVTDPSGGEFYQDHVSDPIKAAQGAPSGAKKILLAHQPKSFAKAFEAGFDLQLSGHTHAGQFFPFSLLMPLAHRYYKGLNLHEDKMWVYVNRGTGYWGPPLRLGVSSEVSLLILKRA